MTSAVMGSAWSEVPPLRVSRFTASAFQEVPQLAEGILAEIRREHPNLPLMLDDNGEPMALVGIRGAIEHFLGQLTEHELRSDFQPPPRIFQDFGRGEVREGRSLDALQAIYRLGIRLAWRRFSEIGTRLEIPPPAMYELADAAFVYLDSLVAESVRGYAEAAARQAGERLRLQRRLLELLLTDHQRTQAEFTELIAERAARVAWPVPHTVAVAVLLRPARSAVPPAVGDEVLLDMECEQIRMVVPDPYVPGRAERVRRATAGWAGALGPPVPPWQAVKSLRWAQAAVALMERGLLPDGELLPCTEHTEALVLLPPEELIGDLARRRLAPLRDCGPTHSRRLAETLLAWLETRGGAPEVAARLGVHPQTVRYRLRQIRELWGAEIDEPDSRFELELVLRTMRLRGELGGVVADGPTVRTGSRPDRAGQGRPPSVS